MSTSTPATVRYDPYDVDIDDDPYPTWRRLRDQAPLYRNQELDFYALSRWDDVKPALIDWETYRSGRGTVLEVIRAGVEIPPGIVLFEDPPILTVLADYVEWRSGNPADDLMTELLNAEVDEPDGSRRPLARDEVVTYASMVAGVGNETATRLIGFTMQLLVQHPDQRRLLVVDPSLIPNAIEEILRLEAPSPVQARYVQRDVEVRGTVVAEGSTMLLLNGAANRDERHFTNPDMFDVHRDEGPHLSFGYGLHYCLGAALARLEGRVALEEILRRWPAWDVDIDRGRMAHTASVRGWDYLPVHPHGMGDT